MSELRIQMQMNLVFGYHIFLDCKVECFNKI